MIPSQFPQKEAANSFNEHKIFISDDLRINEGFLLLNTCCVEPLTALRLQQYTYILHKHRRRGIPRGNNIALHYGPRRGKLHFVHMVVQRTHSRDVLRRRNLCEHHPYSRPCRRTHNRQALQYIWN